VSDLEEGVVYLNGRFVPESEAKVSVFDRGFGGGEGVYEVTRTFAHKPFKLREHIQRLYRSMRYTRIAETAFANARSYKFDFPKG
jgi:branched-chain amino acid aminotransferase